MKTFEEMEWDDESIIDQEEILQLEFTNGPLEEIQEGSRTTLKNYRRFRQFFTPTKKFHQVLRKNQEMNHTIRERHKSETKRMEKLCRAEKEKRTPWQRALETINQPCIVNRGHQQNYPKRIYSMKDDKEWRKKQEWSNFVKNEQQKEISRKAARAWNQPYPQHQTIRWDDSQTDYPIDYARDLDPPYEDNHYLNALGGIISSMGRKCTNDYSYWGTHDNKNWEESNQSTKMKTPIQKQDSIYTKNLKKGRCPHGIPWYHAESECGWCRVNAMKTSNNVSVNHVNVIQNSNKVET